MMKFEGGDGSAMVAKTSQPWKRKHDIKIFTGCSMVMVGEEEEEKYLFKNYFQKYYYLKNILKILLGK